MTDIIETPAAPVPSSGSSLAPDRIASAREAWLGYGYSAEAFDSAMAGTAPAEPQEPGSGTGRTDAAPVEVVPPTGRPLFDQEQAREIAAALIAAGVPEEQVNAALQADGFEAAPADERSDGQKEFDKAFLVARPEEIKVDYRAAGIHDADPADIAALNTGATTWASECGFDPVLGAAVVERVVQVNRAFKAMTPAEQGLFKAEQRAIYERQVGSSAAEMLTMAADTLARAGHTEFAQVVRDGGAIHDAWTLITMAHLTERLAKRPV